jgi:hypothetical protein
VYRTILADRRVDRIQPDLDKCPIGEGHKYRDLVAESLTKSLGGVVDAPLSRKELGVSGGRADIELPIRIEALSNFPLWDHWARRYEIRSIVIESKNQDIGQLERYLNHAGLGSFGIFVARKGFGRNALTNLAKIAKDGDRLILPLDHEGLHQLAKASRAGNGMEYLRRQETLLLQQA